MIGSQSRALPAWRWSKRVSMQQHSFKTTPRRLLAACLVAASLAGCASAPSANLNGLPHYPVPGGQMLRVPFSAIGAWYYSLRDRLGF